MTSPRRLAAALAGVAAGAVLLLAGTFAPWLQSGQSRRNSYQAAGLLQRLTGLHGGPAGVALDAWPLLAFSCGLLALLFALGARRVAAVVSLVVALGTGAVAVLVLRAPAAGGIQVVLTGPILTLCGAGVAALASAALLASLRRGDSVARRTYAHHEAGAGS